MGNKKRELHRNSLFCTPAGVRTLDTLIKSQVLYQLSYKRNFSKMQSGIVPELRVQRYAIFLNPPNIFTVFSAFLAEKMKNTPFSLVFMSYPCLLMLIGRGFAGGNMIKTTDFTHQTNDFVSFMKSVVFYPIFRVTTPSPRGGSGRGLRGSAFNVSTPPTASGRRQGRLLSACRSATRPGR